MNIVAKVPGVAQVARTASCRSYGEYLRPNLTWGACSYSSRSFSYFPSGRIRTQAQNAVSAQNYSTNSPSPPSKEAPPFAFAFDIDGVLLHVSKPIPGATETLAFLQKHKIPFILLTNGGGRHESERVADLSSKLHVPLTTSNFVQSHTPFQDLVPALRDKTILVTGSDASKCRSIAHAYGFTSVVTPADILAACPEIYPFEPLLETLHAATAQPLPARIHPGPSPVLDPSEFRSPSDAPLKIDAIFIFNDPRDWAVDIQIITDLLLSQSGYLGTYSPKNGNPSLPNCGWQSDSQPALYFSNADLYWSTGYHLPRFGQGAFQAAVAGVWRRVTSGHELIRRAFGKPSRETYAFAERVLERHRHELLREAAGGEAHGSGRLERVYMVGDNPESDIAGANEYRSESGTEWKSVLVKTGVWSPERGGGVEVLKGRFKPDAVVDDVREAVRWALEREGWEGRF